MAKTATFHSCLKFDMDATGRPETARSTSFNPKIHGPRPTAQAARTGLAGFHPGQPSAWLAEGLTFYLNEASVLRLFGHRIHRVTGRQARHRFRIGAASWGRSARSVHDR